MPTSKEELIRRGIPLHPIQHNQHRRAEWHNYSSVGLYMITLCVDGRQPLFGHLEGDIRAKREGADFPHIVLSSLGRTILNEELPKIHHFYPQIELWKAAIMPDHIHLLLYVAQPLPKGKHLGHVMSSFKGGCSRAWWAEKTAGTRTAAGAAVSREGTAADAAGTGAAGRAGTGAAGAAGTGAAGGARTGAAGMVPAALAAVDKAPLFEEGFHDRIIKRPGMLENIKRYMSDNPLRALMRRQLPSLMERRLHLRVGSHDYAAFGALFLLKRAEKEQVFYHRKDKKTGMPTELTEKYREKREEQLAEAREGVVLVSPAISKGEKLVIDTAIDEGLPVIHLQKEAIGRYWKPELKRFEACARGALLILAPWGLDEEIIKNAAERKGTAADAAGTKTAATAGAAATAGTAATAGAGATAGAAATAGTAATAGAGATAGAAATAATAGAAATDYARFHRLNDLAEEICAFHGEVRIIKD